MQCEPLVATGSANGSPPTVKQCFENRIGSVDPTYRSATKPVWFNEKFSCESNRMRIVRIGSQTGEPTSLLPQNFFFKLKRMSF